MTQPATASAHAIEQRLQEKLQPSHVQVLDESAAHAGHAGSSGASSGTHFRVRIGAPVFAGLTRVARHRLVYDALQEFIEKGVHAIAIEIT